MPINALNPLPPDLLEANRRGELTDTHRCGLRALSRDRRALACIVGLLLTSMALAQITPVEQSGSATVLRAAQILDVRTGSYVKAAAIWVEGERIKAAGPAADVLRQAPASAQQIDLGDVTVLPGLIDCHTHLLARILRDERGASN